jgi:hypothetical protein
MILQPPKTDNPELDSFLYDLAIDYNELVDTFNLIDGAVTNGKIANNSITTNKLALYVVPVSANYLVAATDYTILANAIGGDINIILPDPLEANNRIINIKKVDTSINKVYLIGNVDTSTSVYIIKPFVSLSVQSNGIVWAII